MDPVNSPAPYQNDEIDLFELFESLWKEKVLIVAITLVITLFGGGYAFLAKPTYEVSVKLNPEASEAAQILSGLSFGESLKVSVDKYVRFIESPAFLEALYNQGYFDELFGDKKPDSPEAALRGISGLFQVNQLGDKKQASIYPYEVLLLVNDPLVGEHLLNQVLSLADNQLSYDASSKYDSLKADRITRLLKQKQTLEAELLAKRNDEIARLEEADSLTLKELNEELMIQKQIYQQAIDDKIKALQEDDRLALKELNEQLSIRTNSYFENLQDRMRSLEEAIAIAKSLNIVEPVALDRLIRKNDKVEANQVVEVVSATKEDPLYMRGTRLLNAELGQLKSRPKDYIPDAEIKKLKDKVEALSVNNQIEVLKTRPEDFIPDEKIKAIEMKIEALKTNNKIEILKSRKSDESFNETLQSIRAELAKLQAESFPDNLQFEFANGKAIAGSSPIKPKKLLILALSVVIGGLVGIVVALVNSTRKKRQAAA